MVRDAGSWPASQYRGALAAHPLYRQWECQIVVTGFGENIQENSLVSVRVGLPLPGADKNVAAVGISCPAVYRPTRPRRRRLRNRPFRDSPSSCAASATLPPDVSRARAMKCCSSS